jgi:hypothetical protein
LINFTFSLSISYFPHTFPHSSLFPISLELLVFLLLLLAQIAMADVFK